MSRPSASAFSASSRALVHAAGVLDGGHGVDHGYQDDLKTMPRSRRTLSGVRSIERVELLALDVYQRANGRPVTLAMVADRLKQLLSHRPSFACGRCEAAARVKPERVLVIVQTWQRDRPARPVALSGRDRRLNGAPCPGRDRAGSA